MIVSTMFRRLNIFDRYFPQFKAIADKVEELHVHYLTGEPEPKWITNPDGSLTNLFFHKFRMKRYPSLFLSSFLSREAFYKAVKKDDPDIYYILSDSWQQEFIRYCAERSGKPFVIRVRGNHLEVERYIRSTWYNRKFRSILREKSFKQADLIIPISNKNREQVLSWGYDKRVSEPIYPGVDFDEFGPLNMFFERGPYDQIVGYAGRLDYEKGCDLLPKIAQLCPKTGFMVAGRPDASVEFPDNVEYLGRIPHEEIPFFYNLIDTFLLPSRTEGFPLVFLEAYASNKKIVASRQVFPEELPLYGVLAERPTPEDLADALMKARDLPTRDIRSEIKGFTWDAFGEGIVRILEDLI